MDTSWRDLYIFYLQKNQQIEEISINLNWSEAEVFFFSYFYFSLMCSRKWDKQTFSKTIKKKKMVKRVWIQNLFLLGQICSLLPFLFLQKTLIIFSLNLQFVQPWIEKLTFQKICLFNYCWGGKRIASKTSMFNKKGQEESSYANWSSKRYVTSQR